MRTGDRTVMGRIAQLTSSITEESEYVLGIVHVVCKASSEVVIFQEITIMLLHMHLTLRRSIFTRLVLGMKCRMLVSSFMINDVVLFKVVGWDNIKKQCKR